MHRREPKIGHVDVKETNKMAELVEDEGPVEITIPEARLDDAGRSYSSLRRNLCCPSKSSTNNRT